MATSKLSVLQSELRDRKRILQEDINDIQHGDEYNPIIYKETVQEISFIDKLLNRIWELKNE
ncbi:hypothetical protein FOA22_22370 [Heyndrickxia oleronia]|uniref:hypothetical protein n=1 Tax=Heyndrickxia oleronia TaxID=38875 RepID=UPI003339FB1C